MRTMVAVTAAALLLAGAASAQEQRYFPPADRYTPAAVVKLEKAYAPCLDCRNEGVIESALAQIAWAGLMTDAANVAGLRPAIDRLVTGNKPPAIRYRAYLVTVVLDHPQLFAGIAQRDYEDSGSLFAALSDRLRTTLATYSDRKWVGEE